MKLIDFVCQDAIVPELQSKDRDGVIEELVDALIEAKCVPKSSRDDVVHEILERENEWKQRQGYL